MHCQGIGLAMPERNETACAAVCQRSEFGLAWA